MLLGDNEKALVWLEKAFAAKDIEIVEFTNDEKPVSPRRPAIQSDAETGGFAGIVDFNRLYL